MKTITQILNEMILENKKEITKIKENLENKISENSIDNKMIWTTWKHNYNEDKKINEKIIEKLIKKVKKITLILSIATMINTISIILINLGR